VSAGAFNNPGTVPLRKTDRGVFQITMKKEIENHEELLKKLVLQGDADAFFSLGAAYFKGRYLKERSGGATHQEAQTRTLADAIELLESVQQVTPGHLDAWFAEHCTILPVALQDGNPENVLDKKLAAETAAFLNRCSRELLRTGSEIKRAREHRRRRFPRILFQNKFAVWLLIVAGIVTAVFLTALLMVKLHSSIVISLIAPGHQFSTQFPPAALIAEEDEVPLSQPAPQTAAIAATSDSIKARPDSIQTAGVPQTGTLPPGQIKVIPSPPVEKRPPPPVVPRARMIVPVPPPQTAEPVQSPAPVTDAPANNVSQPAPAPAMPTVPEENESP
jgi:hypothetical protein